MATALSNPKYNSTTGLVDIDNDYLNPISTNQYHSANEYMNGVIIHYDRNEATAGIKKDQLETERTNQRRFRVMLILLVFCLLLAGAALITSLVTSSTDPKSNMADIVELKAVVEDVNDGLNEFRQNFTQADEKSNMVDIDELKVAVVEDVNVAFNEFRQNFTQDVQRSNAEDIGELKAAVEEVKDALNEHQQSFNQEIANLHECKENVTESYGGEVDGDIGGNNFNDYTYYRVGGEPTELILRFDSDHLYCLGFRYGDLRGRCNGGKDVNITEIPFVPGEYIHAIELGIGTMTHAHFDDRESKIVQMMKFYTNERTLGPYGDTNGKTMNITGVKGAEKLSYISGRCGGRIDSIRFHFIYDCFIPRWSRGSAADS